MLNIQIPKSLRILIGMGLGLLIGSYWQTMFYGVDEIAMGFVMLLQMTALPYILLSLITGIASVSLDTLKHTLKHALLSIFLLMGLILVLVLIAPIAFPNWENSDFYSANLVGNHEKTALIQLFIPKNPFNALATGIIPSVVLFSIFMGIGLSSLKHKKYTLHVLNNLKEAVSNINSIVMKLAPLGVGCIALKAAVTIDGSQLDGLKVYLATALLLAFLLAFIILPATIAICTPFSYRQILKASRATLLTAFATGSFFGLIPSIIEETKNLLKELPSDSANKNNQLVEIPNIIVPITYSLPVGGKLLALLFPLFAAWFSGTYIGSNDYISLIFYGLPQLFGSSTAAMHTLLELFNVSESMFDFFLISENLLVSRLSALLSVSFAVCLPLLISSLLLKKFSLNITKFKKYIVIIPLLTFAMFLGLRFSFDAISHQYEGYNTFIKRDFILPTVKTKHLLEPNKQEINTPHSGDVFTKIKQRGFLRVGYFRDNLPYSFNNEEGKLVGFDIEIFNQLALDLEVDIELVRIYRNQATTLLASGYLDITSGVPLIPDNMQLFTLTTAYSAQSIVFVVKDERRSEFTNWNEILKKKDLIIGIPETFFYTQQIKRVLTTSKAWEISSPRLFFREEHKKIEAMLIGGAAGSGWTLLNPDYTVVIPKPVQPPISMAFPIHKNDYAFELFMRNWIYMKKQSKTIDKLFNYWVAGQSPIDNTENK